VIRVIGRHFYRASGRQRWCRKGIPQCLCTYSSKHSEGNTMIKVLSALQACITKTCEVSHPSLRSSKEHVDPRCQVPTTRLHAKGTTHRPSLATTSNKPLATVGRTPLHTGIKGVPHSGVWKTLFHALQTQLTSCLSWSLRYISSILENLQLLLKHQGKMAEWSKALCLGLLQSSNPQSLRAWGMCIPEC